MGAENVKEAINTEADLLLKVRPIPESDIFKFMDGLRGGTYFNMGMYNSISIAKAYKATLRLYKVVEMTAIVSGVSYENIATTKDFRDQTGKGPGGAWYDHMPGYENRVAQHKTKPENKYILWDIKKGSGTKVGYYLVDIQSGQVTPVSKEDVLNSTYLTATEKQKLQPTPVTGYNQATGEFVENQTKWRTAAFDHVFWLSQNGEATAEYGVRFEEAFNEGAQDELFRDANANVPSGRLDALLAAPTGSEFDLEF